MVSENCTTDFFHSWITSLACFIFTGTSCCGRKHKYTLALLFVSLSGTYFPFLSSFRYLSAMHLGLQQMFRAYLCVSAQCFCTHISTGIRIAVHSCVCPRFSTPLVLFLSSSLFVSHKTPWKWLIMKGTDFFFLLVKWQHNSILGLCLHSH